MSLRIIKAGISTTLQDAGRRGFQAAGVPVSGAMDLDSMRLANILCGNDPGTVVLETTLHGAEWLAEEEQLIAFSGAGATLLINNQPAPYNKAIRVRACSLLSLKPSPVGCRSYLAVAGGFKSKMDLKSASTYKPALFGGYQGRALKAGDLLEWNPERSSVSEKIFQSLLLNGKDFTVAGWSADFNCSSDSKIVRIFRGPEWDWFNHRDQDKLFNDSFGISNQSDRMGYRLTGSPLNLSEKKEMLSTAVCKGVIQVTHDGNLVLLMADAQTTGGYPRIAVAAAADLSACAQLRPGDRVHFVEISIDDAVGLITKKETILKQVEKFISLKYV